MYFSVIIYVGIGYFVEIECLFNGVSQFVDIVWCYVLVGIILQDDFVCIFMIGGDYQFVYCIGFCCGMAEGFWFD